MIIRAIQLRIETPIGPYGFSFSFARNLTVIRGGNSSGKSTFVNSLLYSLGMEELIGGKGAQVLPYAVRDYLDYDDQRIQVLSSEILTEIENRKGTIVTLRRAIRSDAKDTKLIDIYAGPALTGGHPLESPRPTYLHDPGSAQRQEGFFFFLENFLDLTLPQVSTTNGGEAKLYLQAIFAAHAVEQKRGWTDYIANIPFYGIRDARTRVAEYILGLGVFETIAARNRLNAEVAKIELDWRGLANDLRREAGAEGLILEGVSQQPKVTFSPEQVKLFKSSEMGDLPLGIYIGKLLTEHDALRTKSEEKSAPTNTDLLADLESVEQEAQTLNVLHERAASSLTMQRASLVEYEGLLREAKGDLERNKSAQKLQELGANQAIELATGMCPTCHQQVEDTLLRESLSGPQMDLQTNIGYLESQSRMLRRQISGLNEGVNHSLATLGGLAARLTSKRDYAAALRSDLGSTAKQSRALVRRQVQLEVEIETLQRLEARAAQEGRALKEISDRLASYQEARRKLPQRQYTADDERKIGLFEKMFRANAGHFGYTSVSEISEIQISRDNLVPGLAQIELREIVRKHDIKADSSASDFVRLIWSYLLALYQTSTNPHTPGNHLGIILFDEPGQHAMRTESQRELLLRLADEKSLQSIVAASFDELESVFNAVTENVQHQLISWEGKLIRPLAEAAPSVAPLI